MEPSFFKFQFILVVVGFAFCFFIPATVSVLTKTIFMGDGLRGIRGRNISAHINISCVFYYRLEVCMCVVGICYCGIFDIPENALSEIYTLGNISDPAKRYFVGYAILKIIINRLNCSRCSQFMNKETEYCQLPSEELIKQKNYGRERNEMYLQLPNDYFFEICKLHFEIFEIYFDNYLHFRDIKSKIVNHCIQATEEKFNGWFDASNQCFEYRKKIADFLILVLLRKNCCWTVKNNLKTIKHVAHTRLRNLLE